MNFYKHYLGDYARDTAHLSLLEHGAYRVLLDSYYATERPLPADSGSLYRICKAFSAAERKAVDRVAAEFFRVEATGDGMRHNQRADEEISAAKAFADAQAERANMRWHRTGNATAHAEPMPAHMPAHESGNASGNALHSHRTSKSTSAAKRAAYPEEFEAIFSLYPARDGDNPKVRAFKAFRARVAEGHSAAEIRAGVERYAAWVRARGKERTEGVKQAATFFGPDKAFLLPWAVDTAQLEPPLFRREGVM